MSLPAILPALAAIAAPVQAEAPAPEPAIVAVDPRWFEPPAVETETPPPVTVTHRHAEGDPLEGFNRRMFAAHEAFDKAVFRPVALAYQDVVPKPVRSGLRNFLRNLTEPIVFLNYVLQLKPGKALETAARFVFNSTLGLGGVLDVAKLPGFHLPHRSNGFGDTLGYYGVKPGPYLFLPFIGPTDLRDLIGGQADGLVLPLAVGDPFDRAEYQVPKGVIGGLDTRAEADSELNTLFSTAVDPYATLRSVYLQDRAGEIARLKGKHAAEPTSPLDTTLSDPLSDPLADPAAAPPAPESTAPELSDPLADPAASSR